MAEKEDILLENSIALQSVLTNLAEKLDNLTKQLSLLLELFEKAASKFNERKPYVSTISSEDKELLNKLDRLLEENKTIARALTLLEERVRRNEQSMRY